MDNSKLFLRPRSINNPKLRLFCFSYAGGSANTYLSWCNKINKEIDLVFIQLPGRGARLSERPHQSMDAIVAELMAHKDFITKYPFVFFGHSLGSRIAFALTCELLKNNLQLPRCLIASGSRAPHLPGDRPLTHHLPENEFKVELGKLNGTPKEVLENEELMSMFMPVLKADFQVAETYQANPVKLNCPIVLFNGTEDEDVKNEQFSAWQDLSLKPCREFYFNGGHFFINNQWREVASTVSALIEPLLFMDGLNTEAYV